jgi:hypothetical protein
MDGPTDDYAIAVSRRFREELVRRDYRSEKQAAEKHLGKPQQWLNARLRGETQWGVSDLHWACEILGLDHMYIVTGQRKTDVAAEVLAGGQVSTGELVGQIRDLFGELRRRSPRSTASSTSRRIGRRASSKVSARSRRPFAGARGYRSTTGELIRPLCGYPGGRLPFPRTALPATTRGARLTG